jgi:hypothetical protein
LSLSSSPGDGVAEVVLSFSHERGSKTNKNKAKQHKRKKNPQSVPSSNAIQFQ